MTKKKKVLITGIAGFVGSHLARRLYADFELHGFHIDGNLGNLAGMAEGIHLYKCDLLDSETLSGVVARVRPDVLFHLAAFSAPSLSVAAPHETLRVNVFSTLNLLEAVRHNSAHTVVVNIGSGDEYGDVRPQDLPITEATELRPVNPYAVSKVAQDMLGFQYFKSYGVKVVRCRPFNHYGARQSEHFAAPAFAKQIAAIEAGLSEENTIKVGNLESARDFLDVRDVVSAYTLLMEKGVYGEVYNICSGRPVKIRTMLETLLSFSKVKIDVSVDPARIRPNEVITSVYGDNARLSSLGWSPRISLEEGLKDLLKYWRLRSAGV